MAQITLNIDRLVLTDLNLSPAEMAVLQQQLETALQQELAQRDWSGLETGRCATAFTVSRHAADITRQPPTGCQPGPSDCPLFTGQQFRR